MKKIIFFIAIVTTMISCSPRLGSAIAYKQPALAPTDIIVVLKQEDNFPNTGIKVGTLSSSDNGFSTHCSYEDVIGKLVEMARQNGANILKITEHKVPDMWSTCDRLKATIYRVENPRQFEKEIKWSRDRKLTWEDFKGKPKTISNTNVAAQASCNFGFQVSAITIFSKSKIVTTNTFDCDLSWVKPDQMNRPDLLEHEQGHFDLCEIYVRQLRKQLLAANLKAFNLIQDGNAIYKQVYSTYLERQELYERETNYGLDRAGQVKWNKTISDELSTLEAYSE